MPPTTRFTVGSSVASGGTYVKHDYPLCLPGGTVSVTIHLEYTVCPDASSIALYEWSD